MTRHLTLFNYSLMTQQLDHFCEQNSNSMPPLNNNKNSWDTNTLHQLWNQLEVHDGILWRRYSQPDLVQPYLQLVIPLVLCDKILRELHEGHVSGHLGMQKLLSLVNERFYWPGHASDVATWCKTCAVCASHKSTSTSCSYAVSSLKLSTGISCCGHTGTFTCES